MVVLALVGSASRASAQGRITVAAGAGVPVRTATATVVAIPVTIDMTAAAGGNIASLSAGLLWDASILRLDSVTTGGFGSLTSNTVAAEGGIAVLSAYSATGATATSTLATMYFTSNGLGGTRVRPAPYTAGDELGSSILSRMRSRNVDVCVAAPGRWGDANGDGSVNILDAQQIARFSIGSSVVNGPALRGQGDVNEDGDVNIIDAQQIARYAVDFPAAPRVNAATLVVPEASTVNVPSATASVQVGRSVQLTAAALREDGSELSGCAPITWSSSDTTKATVDADGVITGVTVGIPTITAASGGTVARIAVSVGVGAMPAAMSIVQGDGQYRIIGNYGVKPQVRVVDSLNRPVPGVSVLFTANSGGVVTPMSGTSRASISVVTDSSGIAEIAGWSGGGAPVPGQTSAEGTVLQNSEQVTATVPGVAPVTFTGIALESEVSASSCMLTLAGAAYCQGEYVSRSVESFADTTLGSVPVLVSDGVLMATLSPGFYGEFNCGVAKTGDGYCWGWNHAGQLGDGTQNRSTGMRRVAGGLSFIKIASGHAHACGITTAGRGYCWGLNQLGQVGSGAIGGISTVPVAVAVGGGAFVLDIATARSSTCAATTSGETWCWGSAPYVDSTGMKTGSPRRIPEAPAFTKLALAESVACGITLSGGVSCWGTGGPALGDGSTQNRYSSFSSVRLPSPALDLWGNADSFCASTQDGGLYCWGNNADDDISGVGDVQPHAVPLLVGVVNATRAQKQLFGFCYQTPDNQPYCFGYSGMGDGESGNAANRPHFSPVPVKWVEGTPTVPAAITFASGTRQSAAAGAAVTVPPAVIVKDFAGDPVVGATVTFAVSVGGGSVTGGTTSTNGSGVATVGGWTLGALGANELTATVGAVNAVVRAMATATPSLMTVISGDNQIQVGSSARGLNRTGAFVAPIKVEVYDSGERPMPNVAVTFTMTGGSGDFLGQPTITVQTDSNGIASTAWRPGIPVGVLTGTASVSGLAPTSFAGVSALGISGVARCALASAGRAYCWGDNTRGQIGDGTVANRSLPTPVSGGLTFASLAEGSADHACGLTSSGQAYCWGSNAFGELGDGTTTDQRAPVAVAGAYTFTQLAVSSFSSCGRTTTGDIVCWGWAGYGLFGDGVQGVVRPPTPVSAGGVTFTSVALGGTLACAVDTSGGVRCWGPGTLGQIGDGQTLTRLAPTPVAGGRSFSTVSVGGIHACALESVTGTAYCWGSGVSGQLGTGVTTNSSVPVAVSGGLTFTSISAAVSGYACARTSTGIVYCWGNTSGSIDRRFWGQLGDGTTIPHSTPAPVLSSVSFANVTTRFGTGCGFVVSGQPYCWGSNYLSQVGDGTATARTMPVAVKWPEGVIGVPVSLAINAGNNYAAVVGTAVAVSPSVIVKDYAGTPLVGTTVTFTVTAGDGTVDTETATTNGLGIAKVGAWTLGSLPGTNTLTVTAPGLPTVVFTATAVPGGGE